MEIYVYDGSFYGVMTCVYDAHKEKMPDAIYCESEFQQTIIDTYHIIKTDQKKAIQVMKGIRENYNEKILNDIYIVQLANDYERGNVIHEYLKVLFKTSLQKMDDYSNSSIRAFEKLRKKVLREKHLFLGIVRFKELENGIYYSKINPTHDILSIISEHFAKRLSNQMWVIYDEKRKKASFYNKDSWHINALEENELALSTQEKNVQKLWRMYFDKIAIKERKNLRQQSQMLPKKYWKNLIEFK